MTPEERTAWRILANKSREKLAEILDAEDVAPSVVAKIAEISANRAWGMPMQAVAFEDEDGKPSPLTVKVEYVN